MKKNINIIDTKLLKLIYVYIFNIIPIDICILICEYL